MHRYMCLSPNEWNYTSECILYTHINMHTLTQTLLLYLCEICIWIYYSIHLMIIITMMAMRNTKNYEGTQIYLLSQEYISL